jgi:hypothetical protein
MTVNGVPQFMWSIRREFFSLSIVFSILSSKLLIVLTEHRAHLDFEVMEFCGAHLVILEVSIIELIGLYFFRNKTAIRKKLESRDKQ